MPPIRPTFALTAGSLRSSTASPAAGPRQIVVERDMDIPADALRLRLMERAGVTLGDPVTVELGYDDEREQVFTGDVVALRPAVGGVSVLALGRMHRLLNLRLSTSFENQTAGSIAGDLVGRAGLDRGTIDAGPLLPRYVVDRRLSAFAHLKDLADRLGYELYADRAGKVQFRALGPAAGLDAAGPLGALAGAASGLLGGGAGYAFGKHLLAAAALRREPAWGAVEVGGESPMSGRGDTTAHWLTANDADYRGAAGDGDAALLAIDPAARTKDLADRFAAGRLAVAARQAHQVWLRVLGRPQIELGDSITTSDVDDELANGAGYVRAIRQRLDERAGFVTDVRISLDVQQ